MYNRAILIGNIGKDLELKQVSNTPYCAFSLATSESYKDKNGEWQTKTEWHNIVVWRNTAEYAAKNLKKGMMICVEGKIRTRSWEDKEGRTCYTTEIVADAIKSLEKKEKKVEAALTEEEDDDLPFFK